MTDSKFKLGSFVQLHGLKNTFYNGKFGHVIDMEELEDTGRLTLELQDTVHPPYQQELKIKLENISLACVFCHKAGDNNILLLCAKCRVAS